MGGSGDRTAEPAQPDLAPPDREVGWERQPGRRDRRSRGRPILLGSGLAAAALLVAWLAVAVSTGEDPQQVASSAPQTSSTTAAPGLPSEAVAVTTGGELVIVDTTTNEMTPVGVVSTTNVLDRNPSDPEEIWFSLCCEPAEGLLRSTRLGGHDVVDRGLGLDPAIDPSGTRLALASTQGLRVVDLGTGEEVLHDQEAAGGIAAPTWVDDDTIAYQRIDDGTWDLGILQVDGPPAPVHVIGCSAEVAAQIAPVMTSDGVLVSDACSATPPAEATPSVPRVFDPETGDERTPPPIVYEGEVVAQDERSGWLLVTYADGRLLAHELATGDSVTLAQDIRTATW